jgi:hypothetical protein
MHGCCCKRPSYTLWILDSLFSSRIVVGVWLKNERIRLEKLPFRTAVNLAYAVVFISSFHYSIIPFFVRVIFWIMNNLQPD